MAKSWGSTKGSQSSDKLDYLSFKAGKNVVRIVSPVLPRYVYWITNVDNKVAAFDCLRFNRSTERFTSGAKDPVHDLGYKEKEPNAKTGKIDALKPKKNYVCWVIDRADNKLKIMEVKATILKGIQSVMGELELEDPTGIDFVIEKSGVGFSTEYKVSEISAMKFKNAVETEGSKEFIQYQKDAELIGEAYQDPESEEIGYAKVPDLDETFPLPSYDEQLENIRSFAEGKKEDKEDENDAEQNGNAKEAANDLDD